MKPSRSVTALAWLLLFACGSAPEAPSKPVSSSPATVPSSGPALSIPGGGRILFVSSEAPGYDWHGIGILEADGSVKYFPRDRFAFPYWDPAASDRILTLPFGTRPEARSFKITDDTLHLARSWPTSELMTFPSPDGETIAYTPVDRSGRIRVGTLRLIDRSTGTTRTIRSGELTPLGWAPNGKLIAVPWSGGDRMLWDPVTGAATSFGPGRFGDVTWAPGGNRFAGVIDGGDENPDGAVVIGEPNGHVTHRVPVGRRNVEMPTWSSDGTRIAFIVRGSSPTGHRTASLHVYDVDRRIDSVVAHPVSDAFWASWSPDGRWLLVADWTRSRWLFVAADGSERVPFRWLGDFPRWCCPSSPAWVQIPVS